MDETTIVGLVSLLGIPIGIAFFFLGSRIWQRKNQAAYERLTITNGTIVDFTSGWTKEGRENSYYRYPIVEFYTQLGELRRFQSPKNSYFSKRGRTVPVRYPAEIPRVAEIDDVYSGPLILRWGGVGLIIGGLGLSYLGFFFLK